MLAPLYELVKDRVVYYLCPKCGSRTILGYGYEINSNEQEVHITVENVNNFSYNMQLINEAVLTHTNFPIRFCVVRNPVDRFVSAYLNKIYWTLRPNGPEEPEIPISQVLDTMDDPSYAKKYEEFLSHVIPQYEFYGEDPKLFTHIFNMSQFDKIIDLLQKETGKVLQNTKLNFNRDMDKKPIPDFVKNKIKKRYQKDYDLYGKWMETTTYPYI